MKILNSFSACKGVELFTCKLLERKSFSGTAVLPIFKTAGAPNPKRAVFFKKFRLSAFFSFINTIINSEKST